MLPAQCLGQPSAAITRQPAPVHSHYTAATVVTTDQLGAGSALEP